MHANHLFRGALHVQGAHLGSDSLSLRLSDRSETLCLQKLDAGLLVAQV